MTGAGMIGASVMTGVAMGTAMTIVGGTIAASVTPTGAGMIATFGTTTDAEMTGAPAMTTGAGTIAISGTMTGADKSEPPHSANVGAAAAGAILTTPMGRDGAAGDVRGAAVTLDQAGED